MAYLVTFKAAALKELEKLPKPVARSALAKATALATNPRPPGCIKLAGSTNMWRIRVGDYRIVYVIHDASKTIDVRIVAHRRDVYRKL